MNDNSERYGNKEKEEERGGCIFIVVIESIDAQKPWKNIVWPNQGNEVIFYFAVSLTPFLERRENTTSKERRPDLGSIQCIAPPHKAIWGSYKRD